MQTSTIKFSQIEDRIDAEYYKPGYLDLENILNKSFNFKTLREISTKIVDGPFGSDLLKSEYIKDGIPLLRVKNISGEGIDINDIVFITHEKQKELQRSKVVAGDLVITKAGRVGTVDIVPSSIPEANITSHLAKISLKKEYNPYFIYMYLNSRLGLLQIERQGIKSTKPELNIDEVAITKIIIPPQSFQQKIEKMVKEAQEKRKLADVKYKEAEEILNKELGFEDLDLSTEKAYEAKFSETEDRFDPEYYQPVYKNVYKFLKQKSKPLTEICKIVRTKISPQNTPEKMFRYIEIGGINNSTGEIEKVLYLHGWKVPSGVKYVVKNNDVLLSAVRTYLKGIALVNNNHERDIATTGFHVLRGPIIKPETLFLFLRSRLGLIQFEKFFLGSTYPVIKGYDLKNIFVPILSQSLQQKISSLIQESFQLRQKAKELINRTKKEVEEMVENK